MSEIPQTRTIQNRQLLLGHLRKTPITQVACEKAGVARSTYYRWREADSEFARQADQALAEGVALINDMAEAQLLNAIRDRNTSAIFYWLNHRHSAYGNKVEVTTKFTNEVLTPEQQQLIEQALENAKLIMKGIKHENTTK